MLCVQLLLASLLAGCDAEYYDWVADFAEDHADIAFQTFSFEPSQAGYAGHLAACDPLRIQEFGADSYGEGHGGTYKSYQETTWFVLRAPAGHCEVHVFFYSSSASSGLGCESSSQISTYKICYDGLNKDCELIESSK